MRIFSENRSPASRHLKSIGKIWELGLKMPLMVREETLSSHPRPCRVAYISDIHLRRGRSELLSGQIMDAIGRADADLILLGGDLVDQKSELRFLHELIRRMLKTAPVFAILGNHDIAVGENAVRDTVTAAGAFCLRDETALFRHHDRVIAISGPSAADAPVADVRVLCAHNPRIWKTAKNEGFDLVLAGHLHGCQAVWFESRGRLFPGAFFYPYNFIRRAHGASRLLVSMGCCDLIPIRWRCPREILLCVL